MAINLWASSQHYVHVMRVIQDKYVEFEYSIGDSELYCEMVLPFAHFEEFCQRYDVKELGVERFAELELDRQKWRYGNFAPNQTTNETP